MNILKQVLTGVTLAVFIVTPMTHTYQRNNEVAPHIKLSENPPSLLESAGYVALFLVAAYVLKNMIPPVPTEATSKSEDPIIEEVTPELRINANIDEDLEDEDELVVWI